MYDPITISRFARERHQETVDKYVLNDGGGPLEEKMYQIIAALAGLGSHVGKVVVSARTAQNNVQPGNVESCQIGTPSESGAK